MMAMIVRTELTDILAVCNGEFKGLSQGLNIRLSLVETLTGERMNGMCSVTGYILASFSLSLPS